MVRLKEEAIAAAKRTKQKVPELKRELVIATAYKNVAPGESLRPEILVSSSNQPTWMGILRPRNRFPVYITDPASSIYGGNKEGQRKFMERVKGLLSLDDNKPRVVNLTLAKARAAKTTIETNLRKRYGW